MLTAPHKKRKSAARPAKKLVATNQDWRHSGAALIGYDSRGDEQGLAVLPLQQTKVVASRMVGDSVVALTETGSRLWGFVHWQDYDLSFLQHWATELWVLCLDGWKDSVGVRKEIRVAESLGLPVKYIGVLDERTEN